MASKSEELRHIRKMLTCWEHGHSWQLLDEPGAVETPDALLIRSDGNAVVGIEVRVAASEVAAKAHAAQQVLGRDLEAALAGRGASGLHVGLSFSENAALAAAGRRPRRASIEALADFIVGRLPLGSSYQRVEVDQLRAAGVEGVSALNLIRSEGLGVSANSGHRHGSSLGGLQRHIDAKHRRLGEYLAGAKTRASGDARARGGAFDGVWLLLVAFAGPGMASSIMTNGAERLSPRGFRRVLVLDYWDDRVREAVGERERA